MGIQIDEEVSKVREQYIQKTKKISELENESSELLESLREKCNHPYVAEAPDQLPGILLKHKYPFRVCEVCGFLEEHAGTGYKILTNKRVRNVSRTKGYELKNPVGEIKL